MLQHLPSMRWRLAAVDDPELSAAWVEVAAALKRMETQVCELRAVSEKGDKR